MNLFLFILSAQKIVLEQNINFHITMVSHLDVACCLKISLSECALLCIFFYYKYKYSHWDIVLARVHYLNASLISALLHGDMANRLNLIWYQDMKKMLLLFEILCTHEGISCSASRIITRSINISIDFLPPPAVISRYPGMMTRIFSHTILSYARIMQMNNFSV